MSTITPFLWFDDQVEEAAAFYVDVFGGKLIEVMRYPEGGPMPRGKALGAIWEIEGQRFQGINGGPMFRFTEAVSLFVDAPTQERIDELWQKLTADGGEPSQCGWLKDKYGLSWQIVPPRLGELLSGPRAEPVMQAMLKMQKLIIADLEAAAS
jgi:predicted 3-demethylubiquinone-9 3-methyltransferase (glyoxalase superfamily)